MSSLWDDLQFFLRQIRWHEPEVVAHFQQTMKMIPAEHLVSLLPRCKTCARWKAGDGFMFGECDLFLNSLSGRTIVTRAEFGCIEWIEK